MIVEGILNFFFLIGDGVFKLLPDIEISFNGGYSIFMNIVSSVCYLLPIGTILTILGVSISLVVLKIVVSIIKTLWDLLPVL